MIIKEKIYTRRSFLKSLALGACALPLASIAGCGSSSSSQGDNSTNKLETIRSRGHLNAGVKKDVPGYGYFDPAKGKFEGLEVNLCYQFAASIFGVSYDDAQSQNLVEYTDVTPKTRGPLIDNGQLDVVCATYTITEKRKESWDFTTPYRTDYIGLMVKKRSNFSKISDLDGKVIGVSQGATTQSAIEKMLVDNNIDATPEFRAFSGYPIIKSSLDAGNIDCFAMDRSTLAGYMNDTVELLEPDVKFGEQKFGASTKKGSDLSKLCDEVVQRCLDDGWLDEQIEMWGLI